MSIRPYRSLIAVMILLLSLSVHARADVVRADEVAVVPPPPRPPEPPPPQSEFPMLGALPFAAGPMPGLRSPVAQCYAAATVCPLSDPDRIGEPCPCRSL